MKRTVLALLTVVVMFGCSSGGGGGAKSSNNGTSQSSGICGDAAAGAISPCVPSSSYPGAIGDAYVRADVSVATYATLTMYFNNNAVSGSTANPFYVGAIFADYNAGGKSQVLWDSSGWGKSQAINVVQPAELHFSYGGNNTGAPANWSTASWANATLSSYNTNPTGTTDLCFRMAGGVVNTCTGGKNAEQLILTSPSTTSGYQYTYNFGLKVDVTTLGACPAGSSVYYQDDIYNTPTVMSDSNNDLFYEFSLTAFDRVVHIMYGCYNSTSSTWTSMATMSQSNYYNPATQDLSIQLQGGLISYCSGT